MVCCHDIQLVLHQIDNTTCRERIRSNHRQFYCCWSRSNGAKILLKGNQSPLIANALKHPQPVVDSVHLEYQVLGRRCKWVLWPTFLKRLKHPELTVVLDTLVFTHWCIKHVVNPPSECCHIPLVKCTSMRMSMHNGNHIVVFNRLRECSCFSCRPPEVGAVAAPCVQARKLRYRHTSSRNKVCCDNTVLYPRFPLSAQLCFLFTRLLSTSQAGSTLFRSSDILRTTVQLLTRC